MSRHGNRASHTTLWGGQSHLVVQRPGTTEARDLLTEYQAEAPVRKDLQHRLNSHKVEASLVLLEVAHFWLHGTVLSPPVPPESFAGLHTQTTKPARRK